MPMPIPIDFGGGVGARGGAAGGGGGGGAAALVVVPIPIPIKVDVEPVAPFRFLGLGALNPGILYDVPPPPPPPPPPFPFPFPPLEPPLPFKPGFCDAPNAPCDTETEEIGLIPNARVCVGLGAGGFGGETLVPFPLPLP